MAELTLQDLRETLARRAEGVEVPQVPAVDVLISGHREVKSTRARRAILLSAAALAAGIGIVFAVLGPNGGTDPERPRPPATPPTSSPTSLPSSLAELPSSDPPTEVAYVVGRTIHFREREITLDERPTRLLQAGSTMIASYEGGRIEKVNLDGQRDVLTETHVRWPVLDPEGRYVAWARSDGANPEVEVRALGSGESYVGSFPAKPTCCDNPFGLDGITASGQLIASMDGEYKAWAWDFAADGGPGPVREIRGLPDSALIGQITANEVVAVASGVHTAGVVVDGVFRALDTYDDGSADLADPLGTRILYTASQGGSYVRDRDAEDDAESIRLLLPPDVDPHDVRWEDDESILFVNGFIGDGSTSSAELIRCDVTNGECSIAARSDQNILLAR